MVGQTRAFRNFWITASASVVLWSWRTTANSNCNPQCESQTKIKRPRVFLMETCTCKEESWRETFEQDFRRGTQKEEACRVKLAKDGKEDPHDKTKDSTLDATGVAR